MRVLILSIASYAIFTLLAGCAQSYEQLLVFLTLQGLGFGGEWAAGAVLVAEYAQATQRGQVVGAVQERLVDRLRRRPDRQHPRLQPGGA